MNIKIDDIRPSPFQHRKYFDDIEDLANSIQRDGLIEPIVVRPIDDHYELIAGERRFRAVSTFSDEIYSRVIEATDLQARRMCCAENMQRSNLSSVEEVDAIVEVIDSELFDFEDYSTFADNPQQRVKYLLGKLHADDINETDYFINKFINKVNETFCGLPTKKKWQSYYINDLPLLNIDDVVEEIAILNKLNKSQTKALSKIKKDSPEEFKLITANTNEKGVVVLGKDNDGDDVTLSDMSANEIKHQVHSGDDMAHVSQKNNDWYTPSKYIESAREVMGDIRVDPASSDIAQKTVKAIKYYTKDNNGLTKDWSGTVWLNPPYSHPEVEDFTSKLIQHFNDGDVPAAIVLVNNATDTNWFHDLLDSCSSICLLKGRIGFIDESGTQQLAARQGQVFIYFGSNTELFKDKFSQFGRVMGVI